MEGDNREILIYDDTFNSSKCLSCYSECPHTYLTSTS